MEGETRRMMTNCKDCKHIDVSGNDEPCLSCYPSMNRPAWEPRDSKRDKIRDHLRHQRRKNNGAESQRPSKANLIQEANHGQIN